MKRRAFNGCLISLIIVFIDYLVPFIPLYNMYKRGFLTQSGFTENIVTGDYQSSLNIHIILMIIYLITEDYVSLDDSAIRMTRYKSVSDYCKYKILNALPMIVYIAVIHEVICMVFILIFGDFELTLRYDYGFAVFFQIIYISLYLSIVYLTKELLSVFLAKSLPVIVTIFAYSLIYYSFVYFFTTFNFIYEKNAFVQQVCQGLVNRYEVINILLRSVGMTLLIYCIYALVRKKRDYIEK